MTMRTGRLVTLSSGFSCTCNRIGGMTLAVRVTSAPAVALWATVRRWRRSAAARWLRRFVHYGKRTLGAAGIAFCAHATANLPEAGFRPPPDPRFARLERFFRHYGCPAPQ